VGRLNFASARRPGRRYRERVGFHKEALDRSSALVNCREAKMEGLYGANIAPKSQLALDLWTVSPSGHRRLSLGPREGRAEERDETMR
jgi:hypothetical protein